MSWTYFSASFACPSSYSLATITIRRPPCLLSGFPTSIVYHYSHPHPCMTTVTACRPNVTSACVLHILPCWGRCCIVCLRVCLVCLRACLGLFCASPHPYASMHTHARPSAPIIVPLYSPSTYAPWDFARYWYIFFLILILILSNYDLCLDFCLWSLLGTV